MSYSMHRIFCAAAGDLEEERQAFYKVIAGFNAAQAMPRGILLVAVSLPDQTYDKRPFQAAINENIRACRYYILVLEDTWGTPEKNFERDYALACRCADDPNLPMQEVAVFFKKPLVPHQVEPSVIELQRDLEAGAGRPCASFGSLEEYERRLHELLAAWLETFATATVSA